MPVHCSDQRQLGLCLGQATTLLTYDLHNALSPILNPFIHTYLYCSQYLELVYSSEKYSHAFWQNVTVTPMLLASGVNELLGNC